MFSRRNSGWSCVSALRSVADVEADEQAPRRWEGRQVDEAHDALVAEVVDLGIEAPVVAPRDEVAAAEVDPQVAPAEIPARELVRHLIGQGDLAQLHVRAIMDVLAGVGAAGP